MRPRNNSSRSEERLRKAYDKVANDFLVTRTQKIGLSGFQNREIEQPGIFSLLPKNLHGKRLLDVGCGPGIHLKEYIRRGAEGYGIDISRKMIELAGNHCPKAQLTIGTCLSLPYKKNEFDYVTASFVLDHVKKLDDCMGEVRRVLRPGGTFIF